MDNALPAIPAKRYFTIGEVSELCGVKPYVLRYWEQEFVQLKPMKRRGNRRYYQHHEVLLIRRIRELLYEEGFTINGARNRLNEHNGHDQAQGGASPVFNAQGLLADMGTPIAAPRGRKSKTSSGSGLAGVPLARATRANGHGAAASLEARQAAPTYESTVAPSQPVSSVSQLKDELESIRQLLGS